jgi:hypothetical protein
MEFFDLTIRPSAPEDATAIERLAQLDSSDRPAGDLLVAEVAGRPIAAIALASGAVIADPFRHTAEAVRLLSLRRSQLGQARDRSRPAPTPRPHLVEGRGHRVRAL